MYFRVKEIFNCFESGDGNLIKTSEMINNVEYSRVKALKRYVVALAVMIMAALNMNAEKPVAKKLFFFGDSMTGWMAERLQAYGEKNGFEVATLIWDGATIKKYGRDSEKLKRYIASANPDAVIVSLGMNELGVRNPESELGASFSKISNAVGNHPVIWVGPCSWPGKPQWGPTLDSWLKTKLGSGHYYSGLALNPPRQSKTNPHPTRQGIDSWMDGFVDWLEEGNGAISLPGYASPTKAFVRPKNYTYRKMNASL